MLDTELPKIKQKSPLRRQVEANLNPYSIKEILADGPKRWWRTVGRIATELSRNQKRDAVKTERESTREIEKCGLFPIKFRFEYAGMPVTCVGCRLPSDPNYSLVITELFRKKMAPEMDSSTPPGKYLILPTTTQAGLNFNNGFFSIGQKGEAKQIGPKIETFKGSLGIAFRPGVKAGRLNLSSPNTTQAILTDSGRASQLFPNGGVMLGVSLYSELNSESQPSIQDVIETMKQNRYYDSYNSDFPCYIDTGSNLYYFMAILGEDPGVTTFFEDRTISARLLMGTFGILQSAFNVKEADQPVRIALAEENNSGYLRLHNKDYEDYPFTPEIAFKLS